MKCCIKLHFILVFTVAKIPAYRYAEGKRLNILFPKNQEYYLNQTVWIQIRPGISLGGIHVSPT